MARWPTSGIMISDSAAAQSAPDSTTASLAGRFLHIAPNQDVKPYQAKGSIRRTAYTPLDQANGNSEPKQAAGRNVANLHIQAKSGN